MPALLGPFVRCWFSVLWLAFFGFTRTGELESLPHAFVQLTRYECHTHTDDKRVFKGASRCQVVVLRLVVCVFYYILFQKIFFFLSDVPPSVTEHVAGWLPVAVVSRSTTSVLTPQLHPPTSATGSRTSTAYPGL